VQEKIATNEFIIENMKGQIAALEDRLQEVTDRGEDLEEKI